MTSRIATHSLLALLFTVPFCGSFGQAPPSVPLYKTEFITSTDSAVFTNIFAIHILSDGGMIAVDSDRRRLLIIDSSMKRVKVVADTAGDGVAFGASSGGLLPMPGDSAVFVEAASGALIVVHRDGRLGRVMALPHVSDQRFLGGPLYGKPRFDVRGRLFYRSAFPANFPNVADGKDTTYATPDSAPVIRVNFDDRTLDTLGMLRVAFSKYRTVQANGRSSFMAILNPIPVIDDWAIDADGTVAIVRGLDYHIDWILPDGSKKSTPKMPFNWRKISEIEKRQIVDSVRRQMDSSRTAMMDREIAAAQTSGRPRPMFGPPTEVVNPDELPDTFSALRPSSRMRFDLDGNLWVIPGTTFLPAASDGGLLYDVFDRNGALVKHVQLPGGRILSGFGPNGLIYMTVPTTTSWTRVERARIVR